MFNKSDLKRNECMLTGKFAKKGYDWWWHSFTAKDDETGKEVPFFVEYFLVNPKSGSKSPVLGQNKNNQENNVKPSYLMVKAGCWGENKVQLHGFYGWDDVNVHFKAPYSVETEDCYASESFLKGKICVTKEDAETYPELMSDAGSMEWELKLDKKVAFNVGYGASGLFRFLKAFEMYWHAEGMKTLVEGKIVLNGRNYTILPETSFGYSDKNWGSGFTSPWVWLSSNDLTSKITGKKLCDSVFDIGGGKPKVFGISLDRKLLSAFWYEGKAFEFNFSKFWTHTKTEFSSTQTESDIVWHVEQTTTKAKMVTDVTCAKKDMLFVNYEDPDGKKRFTELWNGGNGKGTVKLYEKKKGNWVLLDEISAGHIGCEYGEFSR